MVDDLRGYEGLETRLGRVRFLLDHWSVIFDPDCVSPWGSPGDGSGVALLPLMSRHPSVRELDRVLGLLFRVDAGDYRHLRAYRCGVEWRTVDRLVRVRRPHRRGFEVVSRRVREPVVPSWVRPGRVERGERFCVDKFRGEVFVPDELWDAWHRPAVAA